MAIGIQGDAGIKRLLDDKAGPRIAPVQGHKSFFMLAIAGALGIYFWHGGELIFARLFTQGDTRETDRGTLKTSTAF